ncbi:hypothetical protein [Candidatus Hecatella orcuttiae]|jgi:hypothetical protein|uniref:hypothetical protein n=1 Tax=Candidatus Hecatella orcuttiae TaxID=1935119 RepID=UPI002867F3A4|nr:hypothetical protein [Candidatus Hecatella orcuttiae]
MKVDSIMMLSKSKAWREPAASGFVSSLALLFAYFGILTVGDSFSHAIEEFAEV